MIPVMENLSGLVPGLGGEGLGERSVSGLELGVSVPMKVGVISGEGGREWMEGEREGEEGGREGGGGGREWREIGGGSGGREGVEGVEGGREWREGWSGWRGGREWREGGSGGREGVEGVRWREGEWK